jgi:hypothetical protein
MELKIRSKGQVIIVSGFPSDSIPFNVAEGFEGIDLTAYSVICASFGRHGDDKAKELHSRAPGTIVAYKYEWRNGWGEGILLPESFNSSRLRFYKSAEQIEADQKAKKEEELLQLRVDVEREIPGLRVRGMASYYAPECRGVEISPEQETYGWSLIAKSLEEAKAKVVENLPLWKEWNDRVLQAYAAHGFYNPGNGNVRLIICELKAAAGFNQRDAITGKWNGGWILFEKRDGEWVETGIQSGDPLNSTPWGF